MPTIKLKSGTLRRGDKRFVAGDTFDTTERMAAMLDCEIVEPPKPPKPIEPQPEHDIEALREQALMKGIDYKKQWSVDKLLKELANHGVTDSE